MNKRITTLDSLRGIAAFSVCWFHFTNSNPSFLSNGPLKISGSYGYLGVVIFFVISGYVLCHSLLKSNYNIGSFPKFIFKRLVRLEPPYLVSLILVLILNYLSEKSSLFAGQHQSIDLPRIISHIGYLSDISGFRWLNPVYWTLGIELQFYILLGCLFPIFYLKPNLLFIFILMLLSTSILFPFEKLVFYYLPSFIIGIIFSLYANNRMNLMYLSLLTFIIFFLVVFFGEGLAYALTIVISPLLIFWKPLGKITILKNLGNLSYSLYLIHVPIGGRIINFGARFTHDNFKLQILVLITAIIISIISAFFLYKFIEKPAMQWAGKFKLN